MTTHLTDSLIAVKVPDGAFNYGIGINGINEPALCYMETLDNDPEPCVSGELLPLGKWELLGRANEVSEEVAATLVNKFTKILLEGTPFIELKESVYENYQSQGILNDWQFKTAAESLLSLVRSKGGGDNGLLVRRVVI